MSTIEMTPRERLAKAQALHEERTALMQGQNFHFQFRGPCNMQISCGIRKDGEYFILSEHIRLISEHDHPLTRAGIEWLANAFAAFQCWLDGESETVVAPRWEVTPCVCNYCIEQKQLNQEQDNGTK